MGYNKKVLRAIDRELKDRHRSKRYSKSLSATNSLFAPNYLFSKPSKRRIYNPNAKYFKHGGPQMHNGGIGEGHPHDPPNYSTTLGKNLPLEINDPDYKYIDYAKKYNVDLDNLSIEDIENLMTNQQEVQDYWQNQTEYNLTTRPTYWDRVAAGEYASKYGFNEYVKKVSKYHTIPADIKKLGHDGWKGHEYEGDPNQRRADYPIDLQNFIIDNTTDHVSYVPQLDTTHGSIDTKADYNQFPLVRVDDRFPNTVGKSYYQNNPTIKPEDGKLCKFCPSTSIPTYDIKVLQRLWQQKTLDDLSYEEVWGDEGPPQETVYAGKTKKLRGRGTYPWSGRDRSRRKKKQKKCNPKDPKCNQYKQRADNRLQHGGPHDPLPQEYLKSQGFADATNQDLDSLLRGFNTDGYDSHWYTGLPSDKTKKNYGVTSDQLRTFAGDHRPKSFVNAAAYAKAMNELAVNAGGKNVSNIPFADNPMVMRTDADDLPVKEEYVAPQTLQEEGYINKTGTDAVNQYQSRGLAKRYTQFKHGGPHDPPEVKQRRGVRKNSDGSVSSHLMRAEYIPERGWVGFPSLFQDDKPYSDDQQNWVDMSEEEDWMKVYEEAERRGEVYDFGEDKEAALAFGKGSWKDQLPERENEEELYNMERARELGYERDGSGHLPSVDEETGMFLKSMDHPTAFKEYMYGQLNKDIGTNTKVVVNPEGHFGDKQLQYIELNDEEADKYRAGGYVLEELHNGGEGPGHPHQSYRDRWNLEIKQNQDMDMTRHVVNERPLLNLDGTDPDAGYNQWINENVDYGTNPNKSWFTHAYEGVAGIPELLTKTIPNYIAETAEDAYDQFSKTSFMPSNVKEDLYHLPANLLAEDYSSYPTRGNAFAQARADGEKDFMYKGKRYNTRREDDDIKLVYETDDPDEQYVFKYLVDETKKDYPILWNLMNKASGVDEISFDGTGSRWISKFQGKALQNKNRGYFHEGYGFGDGATIHVGEYPFEAGNNMDFLNVLIAELAHRTGHQPSNNPLHGITHRYKSAYEGIKHGDQKRYQTPGTDEFNNHRLVEPGIHMTVHGQMTPAIVKKVQNFLGVEEDGIFGEDTYSAMVDRFKNNERIKASLEEYAKEYKSDQHPELPINFGESWLWADYLQVLSAHLPELTKTMSSWGPYSETVATMDKPIPFTKESFKNKKITDFDIRELQTFLAQQGYKLPNSLEYVSERYGPTYDGIAGDETKTAFKNYRKKLGYKKQGGSIEEMQDGGGKEKRKLRRLNRRTKRNYKEGDNWSGVTAEIVQPGQEGFDITSTPSPQALIEGFPECPPFHIYHTTLQQCVPMTEQQKADYGLNYMQDWANSPQHKIMLRNSLKKDYPNVLEKELESYVNNVTGLRKKVLNPKITFQGPDDYSIGHATPLNFRPRGMHIIDSEGNVISGLNDPDMADPNLQAVEEINDTYDGLDGKEYSEYSINTIPNFQTNATFNTLELPGNHAYVYPHEFSHVQKMGWDLIPESDILKTEEYSGDVHHDIWMDNQPMRDAMLEEALNSEKFKNTLTDYQKKYLAEPNQMRQLAHEYVLGVNSFQDSNAGEDFKKTYLKTFLDSNKKEYNPKGKLKNLYLTNKDLYENNFDKFLVNTRVGRYLNTDNVDNSLPYDEFIKKYVKDEAYYKGYNDDMSSRYKYVAHAPETIARLDAIRMYGKAAGIYDPMTEPLTKEKFNELIEFHKKQNPKTNDANQLQQLLNVYDEEEIFEMLNTISKSEETSNILDDQYAQEGGSVELGDKVDEATMQRLKKQGYTFQEI
jgi:hypothetical protein